MRVSFITLLPALIALASWSATFAQAEPGHNSHRPDSKGPNSYGANGNGPNRPREFLDFDDLDFALERREEFLDNAIFERREFLEELTTRELIDELTDRLERRGNTGSKIKEAIKPKKKYGCPYCGAQYDTPELAKACATKPQILGGCKVMGALKNVKH